MTSEQTPLITHVRVGSVRRRYRHNTCRRFCTIALGSTLLFVGLWLLLLAILLPPIHPGRHGYTWPWNSLHGGAMNRTRLSEILRDTPSAEMARKWSQYYTAGPHLAGKNYSQAAWTKERWEEWGVQSSIAEYDVYLNYPVDHRLALLEASGDKPGNWTVSFEASLKEDVLDEDPTSGLDDRIPTFHGYSASGNVTAPVVFVNYGTYQDFEDLRKANVSLAGKVAIARYGGVFRGLKVKRAQEMGMVGVLLYSDPGDDGEVTEANGYKQYPKGPARHPSSVQRGSAQFVSILPGDPTTPGYPSLPGAPRASPDDIIPKIPSIPISYADALPILKALNGHGPRAKDMNKYWTKDLGLGYKGVDYYIGPTPDTVVVNLYNKQEYVTTPLWNVIGIINGTIPDEVIVVGNHRDAWIAGGAGDPNSGSAVLNEVVRSFGKALSEGWQPLRTIVFASWDGEEYALIGSTEWVEEYLPWLSRASVAYVNVDVAVKGPHFSVAAAPLLHRLLHDVTATVPSPNQTTKGQTVGDLWDGRIRTMGSGSDFTAFQDFAGIPCIDMGFGGGDDAAVYHYHSNYDSFAWMDRFGDPGFAYHRTMAQILGLVTARLAQDPLVALNATDYAKALEVYVDKVAEKVSSEGEGQDFWADDVLEGRGSRRGREGEHENRGAKDALQASLRALERSVGRFLGASRALDGEAEQLAGRLKTHIPWWHWLERIKLVLAVRRVNTKYKLIERHFLHAPGLDGRSWFKHVIFAPGLWTGYAGAVFPGIVESMDTKDYGNAMKWVRIIEGCIERAAGELRR